MPRIQLKGYFGWKESMKVTAATVTTGWLTGQCFKLAAGAGDPYSANEVQLCDTGGELVYGIALDSSADHATSNVSGMNIPSASKVTILHGHSKFEIDHAAEVAAGTFAAGTCAYEYGNTFTLNGLLYTNASGKLTSTPTPYPSGSYQIMPVGFCSQVPIAANNWTLGVVLFG